MPPPPAEARDQNGNPRGDGNELGAILQAARPFLRGELESVDPRLPSLAALLRSTGAGECFHKHGSFLHHLLDVYRILKLWKAPDAVCLCGLFHSAYSNSYVNLAIFDPSTGRDTVRRHVGPAAERLIHLFCVVPRQSLIHDDLLFRYTDPELAEHLRASEASLRGRGACDGEEGWRRKLREVVPAEGVVVRHIRTGEEVRVSRRVVGIFLLLTMADFSDQLFGFQDALFENEDGRMDFSGADGGALWPGDGRPGLWMNLVSRMGALYQLIAREEEIWRTREGGGGDAAEEIELVIPPVFEGCTRVLDAREQIEARDLYWEAAMGGGRRKEGGGLEVVGKLRRCVEKNPYVGEAEVVLAQAWLGAGNYEAAEAAAGRGLRLLLEWGSPWDKRVGWEGWVAWARVLLQSARERSWPTAPFAILNLGLVR